MAKKHNNYTWRIVGIILAVIIVGGGFFVLNQQKPNQDNINNLKVGDCVMSDYTKGHIQGYDYARIVQIYDSKPNDGICYVNWVVKGNTQQADFYGGGNEGTNSCNKYTLVSC